MKLKVSLLCAKVSSFDCKLLVQDRVCYRRNHERVMFHTLHSQSGRDSAKCLLLLWMSFYGCVVSCCSFLLSLSPVVVVSVISLLST